MNFSYFNASDPLGVGHTSSVTKGHVIVARIGKFQKPYLVNVYGAADKDEAEKVFMRGQSQNSNIEVLLVVEANL